MLEMKRYTCVKCGRTFTKMAGGIVMSPREMQLEMRPVCDKCKFNAVTKILDIRK